MHGPTTFNRLVLLILPRVQDLEVLLREQLHASTPQTKVDCQQTRCGQRLVSR